MVGGAIRDAPRDEPELPDTPGLRLAKEGGGGGGISCASVNIRGIASV